MSATCHSPIRRLLMTADTVGGMWTYAFELAQALQEYGIDIVLATMGSPLDAQQAAAVRQVKHLTVFESPFKLEWMGAPWDDVAAAGSWLLELEAQTQPDVVHLNGYAHGALPWQSPTLMVGHFCVFSWFAAVKRTPPSVAWERYRREVARGLRAADLVTAPTAAMRTALRTHYETFAAAPPIYHGRRAASFLPMMKEPCILTAGRVRDAARNVAALEQVAPGLSWPVFVAGEAPHPAGGAVRFRSVQCLGQLAPADLATWLGSAAIFALPARYEPFGFSALEAGLAGCALVLGDLPNLREVWGDAALFVPPDQPNALAEALQGLIKDVGWRVRMAQRAHMRALQYTPERMAREYVALYAQLMRMRLPVRLVS